MPKSIVKGQRKYNLEQTIYSTVDSVFTETGAVIKAAEKLRKSAWKQFIKQKIKGNIQKKLWEEMRDKTKSRAIEDDKLERKKYIDQYKGDTVKDIIKIGLQMWDLKKRNKNHCEHYVKQRMTQQSMCYNF